MILSGPEFEVEVWLRGKKKKNWTVVHGSTTSLTQLSYPPTSLDLFYFIFFPELSSRG